MFEYIIVFIDGTSTKVVSESLASIVSNYETEENPIVSIIRNGPAVYVASGDVI